MRPASGSSAWWWLSCCSAGCSSTLSLAGGGREGAGVRGTIATLAVVGSVIACGFSYVGWVSDESDVSGGLGPVVLLAGVLVGVAVLRYRPWQDLATEQPGLR